jgi:hypothetical protein
MPPGKAIMANGIRAAAVDTAKKSGIFSTGLRRNIFANTHQAQSKRREICKGQATRENQTCLRFCDLWQCDVVGREATDSASAQIIYTVPMSESKHQRYKYNHHHHHLRVSSPIQLLVWFYRYGQLGDRVRK